MTRAVAVLALLTLATPALARRAPARPHPPVALATVSRTRTMLGETHLFDYASLLCVDSTRGVPEAGYWRVPAGDVRVWSEGGDTLALRATPDLVNGLAYFSPPNAFHYREGATYTCAASGSDTVGAFVARVIAPTQPRVTAPAMDVAVPAGAPLVVEWDAGAPGDSVIVSLMVHAPNGGPHWRLRAPDTGRIEIAPARLRGCPPDYPTMITITRERRAAVEATGLRGGWFTASASDYVHFTVARPAPRRAPRR